MSADELTLPKFQNEREEADWWAANPDFALKVLERAGTEGRLGRGTVSRRIETVEAAKAGAALALDAEDVARANKLAERKGIERSAYLKDLLHSALLKEEESMNSSSAA
jgi:hypothetical protein